MAGGLDARLEIRLAVDAVLMRNPPPRSNLHETAIVSDKFSLAMGLRLSEDATASDLFRANTFAGFSDLATASDVLTFLLFSNDALKLADSAIASDSAVLVLTGDPTDPGSGSAPTYAMTTDDGTVITDGQGNIITTQ